MGSRVKDKVAIITGGAGGIGSSTGRLLCEEGASVVLVDRDATALEDVANSIRSQIADAQVLAIVADVGKEAEAQRIVTQTMARFNRIDVLVNNAGVRAYWRIADAPADSWQDVLAVNLLSYAYLAKAALPALRQSGKGSIVNISSTYGLHGRAGMGQYDATKAGILALTRTLAFEETEHGVRANAVCPGYTLTPFHVKAAQDKGQTADALREEKVQGCLMQRWADPREVAYPILWLASDEASYITASTLMVDGGRPVL